MKPDQPALPGIGDTRPPEITVNGEELGHVLARIKAHGGRVERMDVVTGCQAVYRLHIFWPCPPCLTRARALPQCENKQFLRTPASCKGNRHS